jgi:hypothetical protein
MLRGLPTLRRFPGCYVSARRWSEALREWGERISAGWCPVMMGQPVCRSWIMEYSSLTNII